MTDNKATGGTGDPLAEDRRIQQIELIMALRSRGIRSTRVLGAIEKIPRHAFVDNAFAAQAYADQSLPIECGQTISQPFVVAYMSELLDAGERDKVLEVGTGSGYQAAVLSQLARRVYTIERYRTLAKDAEEKFRTLGLSNITGMVGDGMNGWPAQAPFDRIIVTAAAEHLPEALLEQLKVGGVMVSPVGPVSGEQHIVRIVRTDDGYDETKLLPVRFVPLVPGKARQL